MHWAAKDLPGAAIFAGMDIPAWLIPAVVVALTPLLMKLVGRPAARPAAMDVRGRCVLRPTKLYAVVGWVSVVIAGVMGVGALFMDVPHPLLILLVLSGGGLFGFLGGILLRTAWHHRVVFDDELMEVTDLRRRTTTCRWHQLISVEVDRWSRCVFELADGTKVKVDPNLIGADGLFRRIAQHTTLPIDEVMRKLGRTLTR